VNAFVLNRHGRLVFPSSIMPQLDFSTMESLDQLDTVIRRDFETKAPSGTDILEKIRTGDYDDRYALMRDIALNLFWANRFSITMYDKRPTRWADLPRTRSDVFLPVLEPWEDGETKVAAVEQAYPTLPARWDAEVEDRVFGVLFDVFGNRRNHATTLPAVKPTVAEFLAEPGNLTFRLPRYDPDYPVYEYDDVLDCREDVPELEALHRWAMVLHNQYPWDRAVVELARADQLSDDDYVVAFHPRDREVRDFLRRLRAGAEPRQASRPRESRKPVRPFPAVDVRRAFTVMPRLECLVAVHGDQVCTNDDVVRNSAYNWSPMSADEIQEKTGVEERRYTSLSLEELALQAAEAALEKAGRGPEEIGGVVVCTCTSSRLIPSLATYICGQLGIHQTHAAYDLVAACAGMPYGLAEAVRLLQEVERPVLVVCAEKFSDKIGNVRPSRMLFADGAAGSLLDTIDLIVPHQANKTMVLQLADRAGLTADQLYFNIETTGNASSASIPLAIHDAVRDGVITEPVRVFAPGFGAGAVAGYAVMRVDPAVVDVQDAHAPGVAAEAPVPAASEPQPASEQLREAFT
jgi:3-oxoacyl-[acyl-carrier-protein] synthase III